MTRLIIETVPTDTLKPYKNNAKIHTPEQVQQIANSILKFGNIDPIGVWTNKKGELEIVEGHGRHQALLALGIKDAPIIRLDHLSDEERRAYALTHNQLTMNTGWNLETLKVELDDIENIEMESIGFNFNIDSPQFTLGTQDSLDSANDGLQDNEEYQKFLEKFEQPKTTDDCYTPQEIYQTVHDWVFKEYNLPPDTLVLRPFYPGGDYANYNYPPNSVVIDNPPFSILAQICRHYDANNIRFFLFAPGLTLAAGKTDTVSLLCTGAAITYENNAKVLTSFITNLEPQPCIRTTPDLLAQLKKVQQQKDRTLTKYDFPPKSSRQPGYKSTPNTELVLTSHYQRQSKSHT